MKLKEYSLGETQFDIMKWLLIVGLAIAGVFGNVYYINQPLSLRLIGGLFIGLAAIGIASQTSIGTQVINFAKLSKTELRKVVWPSRQETVRTTMVVVAMICIASILMWCLDAALFWAVGLLTI